MSASTSTGSAAAHRPRSRNCVRSCLSATCVDDSEPDPHDAGGVRLRVTNPGRRQLGVSVRTVETHRLNLKRKLEIEGQAELIKFAVEHRRPG